jgi:O-antigen/teichoic acid export membrane protein
MLHGKLPRLRLEKQDEAGETPMKEPGTGSLSRNSFLNFATQVYSVIIAFAALPFIVHGVGPEGFGLLTLLWMFVGYFSVIDFGAGQSALRFLSLGVASRDVPHLVRTFRMTLRISLSLGMLSAAIVTAVSFTGATGLVRVDEALRPALGPGLRLLALALPAQLLQISLKSFPMAFNRYGFNSVLQMTSATVQWVGGAIIAATGGGFMGVLLLTVISRYTIAIGYLACAVWLVPEVRHEHSTIPWGALRPFISYGGWAAVPQLVSPLFTFLERLVVGTVLSLVWVTYFTIPSDTVSRFLIFPMSIVYAAFPVFSGNWISDEGKARVRSVYVRSMKLLTMGILPVALVLGVFAREILTMWLGAGLAGNSALPLMIMAAGMVCNVLSQLPVTFLQAVGRPDVPAKIVLVQAPLYAAALVLFSLKWGIIGTAAAWTLRVGTEMLLLTWRTRVIMKPAQSGTPHWLGPVLTVATLTGLLLLGVQKTIPAVTWMIPASLLVLCAYSLAIWRLAMDPGDRQMILNGILPALGVRSHGS